MGEAQFATAEPAGIELIGHTMQDLMESRGDVAWLQLDCTNALGELSRKKCLQASNSKMPHLLAFEAQWLTQATRAIAKDWEGHMVELMVTGGLDQEDPVSPVAFAATLTLGELQTPPPSAASRGYRQTRIWVFQLLGRPHVGCAA